jgi:hypothetical protein
MNACSLASSIVVVLIDTSMGDLLAEPGSQATVEAPRMPRAGSVKLAPDS